MKRLSLNKNKGIALPITIIVFIGMLIGVAILIRYQTVTMDVTNSMSRRSQVVMSNDLVIKKAISWLEANKANLNSDNFASGYHSSAPSGEVNYADRAVWGAYKTLPEDNMRITSSYAILRLCKIANAARNDVVAGSVNTCSVDPPPNSTMASNSSSSVGYGNFQYSQTGDAATTLYLIVTESHDPTQTVSVQTQTVVSF